MYINHDFALFVLTVPANAPASLKGRPHPREIELEWTKPDPPHNGIILGYKITYQISGEGGTRKSVSVKGLSYVLAGLEENREYVIYVSAETSAGFGPPTSNLILDTIELCK